MLKIKDYSELGDVVKGKVLDDVKSRIKIYPCHSNRASQLADPCLRKLVYYRTHWQKSELHDVDLQLIFDEGNYQEKIVLKELAEAGVGLEQQQRPFEWKEYQITGHIDGMLPVSIEGKDEFDTIPVEIKSMSPNIWRNMHSVKDLEKYSWTAKYVGQVVLYMLMGEAEYSLLMLKNKTSGQFKMFVIKLNDWLDLGEELIQKAEAINKHIKEKTLPDFCDDPEHCLRCQFRHICLPDMKASPGVKFIDKPELEAKLKRLDEIKAPAKEFNQLNSEVKKEVEEQENLCVGDYLITGKFIEVKRKAQPAKEASDSKYWKSKIISLVIDKKG